MLKKKLEMADFVCFFFTQVGASVVVNVSETNQVAEGVINKVNDCSMYTVGKCIDIKYLLNNICL